MSEKNLVQRDESQRAHVYKSAISSEQVQGKMLNHLLNKAFDNSVGSLVMQALATRPASSEELAEIRQLLDEMEGEEK
jgi:predicted transcriptional regulator